MLVNIVLCYPDDTFPLVINGRESRELQVNQIDFPQIIYPANVLMPCWANSKSVHDGRDKI